MKVSLSMIVKNEEANIRACLDSTADLFDGIVVVDTGSTDRTKELAAHIGARVFEFSWCDDFSAARNESLRSARGDSIFWLDADDRLDEENRDKLRALLAALNPGQVAYQMWCLTRVSTPANPALALSHIRLFRNHPGIRWQHRVHEQIMPAILAQGDTICPTDIIVQHTGYEDAVKNQRKQLRNLSLLQKADAEQPNNVFTLFNLGMAHFLLNRPAEALPFLKRSLAGNPPDEVIVRKLYALLGEVHAVWAIRIVH